MKNREHRYWRNLTLFTIVSFIFASTVVVPYLLARPYLHPVKRIPSGEALIQNNIPYQEIELTTSDGVTLAAWYTPPQNGAVILLAHGHGDNRAKDLHVLFTKNEFGALSWDFRAHGASGGNASTIGYYEQLDVEAALDYALAQPNVKHVGAWGGSMGGATIILAAAKRPEIEAVIADSAFPSLEEAAQLGNKLGFLQPLFFFIARVETGATFEDVRPIDEIGKIAPRPVFIIDGWKGFATQSNAPYRLYDAANEPKQIWVEDNVPHLQMIAYFPEKYARKTLKFFEENLLKE